MPESEGTSAAEHNWDTWMSVLAAMEANLAHAERPIDSSWVDSAPVWLAPTNLGQLPEELADYAAQLVQAQGAAIERLEKRQRTVARHLSAVRSVPSAQDTARPPYLDVTG